MRRIKMVSTLAGPAGVWLSGSVQEVPDELADRLVEAKAATIAAATPAARREKAQAKAPERRSEAETEPPDEETEEEVQADNRTHELNARDAVELVWQTEDPAELEALELGERAHPKYAGGRRGVLAAIEEVQEALAEG